MYICNIQKVIFDPTKEYRKALEFEKEHPDWIKKELGTKATMYEKKDDYYIEEEYPVVYYNGRAPKAGEGGTVVNGVGYFNSETTEE